MTKTEVLTRMADLISDWGRKIDVAEFADDEAAGAALGKIVVEIYTLVQGSVLDDIGGGGAGTT